MNNIKTLGELKASGYRTKSIKQELRENLIQNLKDGTKSFERIIGYENTVIPSIENAVLAGHNITLLGLRGQAKTSIARAMTGLLDEYIPVIDGGDLNDDPLQPLSAAGKDLVEKHGDKTPIKWMHRDDRYAEKLATPDVSVADLIGDTDPIKAANLKLPLSDERVIHYGIVPNSNRCIFVINELPDLQPRIQVALFNILQEGDIQIRGFKVRLPLDILFVFTANPEDYTNRGSIITPLKDRVQSQIITHYPKDLDTAKTITTQEAKLSENAKHVTVNPLVHEILEQVAFEARKSEFVDQKSGVSTRLSITAYELLVSTIERRMIINDEETGQARISDLYNIIPALTGKLELVYEGEQEGQINVAYNLLGMAIRTVYVKYFPNPERTRKQENNPYRPTIDWFGKNEMDQLLDADESTYRSQLDNVTGLDELAQKHAADESYDYLLKEFALHGLAEYSQISKSRLEIGFNFKDLLGGMSFGSNE